MRINNTRIIFRLLRTDEEANPPPLMMLVRKTGRREEGQTKRPWGSEKGIRPRIPQKIRMNKKKPEFCPRKVKASRFHSFISDTSAKEGGGGQGNRQWSVGISDFLSQVVECENCPPLKVTRPRNHVPVRGYLSKNGKEEEEEEK